VKLGERAAELMSGSNTRGRLKAILPVHAFGHIADMHSILDVAAKFELPVVEDAACALGARLHGRPAGSWGNVGAFSLHPRKAITTGEGGAIATDDDAVAWKVRTLRNHGIDAGSPIRDFVMPGFNYRMTDFQAALGVTQCAKLSRVVGRRQTLAAKYAWLLKDSPVTPPHAADGHEPVFQSYVCLLPSAAAPRRASLIAALRDRGIEATIGTWHVPMTTYFRTRYGFQRGDFPVCDDVCARALSLPLHERLEESEQEYVVSTLLGLLAESS
jgi:perosamine synthetase